MGFRVRHELSLFAQCSRTRSPLFCHRAVHQSIYCLRQLAAIASWTARLVDGPMLPTLGLPIPDFVFEVRIREHRSERPWS